MTRTAPILLLLLLVLTVPAVAAARTAAFSVPDSYSATAAESVLLEGGNAVDAAIAVAFVLAVTNPDAGNIGGGGFMLAYVDGQASFLDFRETAPGLATSDMYLDEQGRAVPERSQVGGLAIGVPGTVKGMLAAHQRFGSLPWPRLLQPAIELARDGFLVDPGLAALRDEVLPQLRGLTNFEGYFAGMNSREIARVTGAVSGKIYAIGGGTGGGNCAPFKEGILEEFDPKVVSQGKHVRAEENLPTKWGEVKSD